MEIFHVYLRATSSAERFEITDDPRWPWCDAITIRVDDARPSSGGRSLRSLIQQLHDRTADRITTVPAQTQVAAAIGESLFQTIIRTSQRISTRFDLYQTRCTAGLRRPRLALHLPPSLHFLPWELLRDPSDPTRNFLALTGSIIRYDSSVPEKDFEPVELPVKLWLIFANPTHRPFSGDTELETPQHGNIIFDQIKPATFERFQATVRGSLGFGISPRVRPFLLAFFGHGDIDNNKIGQFVFVKKGDRVGLQSPWVADPRPSYAINDTIVTCPLIRIVFLCACESAWAETTTTFENSIAGALLKSSTNLGYVIGAQTKLDVLAADLFLSSMLSYLPSMSLDLAVSDARANIRGMSTDGSYSALDWWVPVLYARAAGFDPIVRPEILPSLQPPPRVRQRAVIGLEAAAGEAMSTRAMFSEMVRRLSSLVSVTSGERRGLFDD